MPVQIGQKIPVYWPATNDSSVVTVVAVGRTGRTLVELPNGSQTWVMPDQLNRKPRKQAP